ncbi:MAG: hypothetical protein CL758_06830 [Chloroflexi bacterium]|nr:hypothetical protein [Chloroflexota bacterium]
MNKIIIKSYWNNSKARLIFIGIILISLFYSINLTTVYADGEVFFEDPQFERLIRFTIKKPNGPIYHEDLFSIRTLEGDNQNIRSIQGIEHLESLSHVFLGGNQIRDLMPLSKLPNLRVLILWDNQVKNLEPLRDLVNLETLILPNNHIEDISPLENLIFLDELALDNNRIENISAISNMKYLDLLHLGQNYISDLSPIYDLNGLAELWIGNNRISDLTPLSNLQNLGFLYLGGNRVTDITPLAGLYRMFHLNMEDNRIRDISTLENLTEIGILELNFNQIEDVSPLVRNSGLNLGDHVKLQGNPINRSSYEKGIPELLNRGVRVDLPEAGLFGQVNDIYNPPIKQESLIQQPINAIQNLLGQQDDQRPSQPNVQTMQPVPQTNSLELRVPSHIEEWGISENGIRWGVAFLGENIFDLGSGMMGWSLVKHVEEQAFFYGHRSMVEPLGGISDTGFSQLIPPFENRCVRTGESLNDDFTGYRGLKFLDGLTDAGSISYDIPHSIRIGTRNSDCYSGKLLFQHNNHIGIIDPIEIIPDPNITDKDVRYLKIHWWLAPPGVTDFSNVPDPDEMVEQDDVGNLQIYPGSSMDRSRWLFEGQQGREVAIMIRTDQGSFIDPYAEILMPNGMLDQAISNVISYDSTIPFDPSDIKDHVFTLPYDGWYEINVTSRNGEEGNYLLVIDSCPNMNNCQYGQLRVEKDSQAVKSFTQEYVDVAPNASGMVAHEGLLFLSGNSRDSVIRVFDNNGDLINSWGVRGRDRGQILEPTNMAVNRDKNWIYISDTGNDKVHIFDLNGNFISSWGDSESEASFRGANGVAVCDKSTMDSDYYESNEARVYVADRDNNRILAFDENGNFISDLGISGLNAPDGLSTDRFCNLYISDKHNNRIIKTNQYGLVFENFNTNGANSWGDITNAASYGFEDIVPTKLSYDINNDLLYVLNDSNGDVILFDSEGFVTRRIDSRELNVRRVNEIAVDAFGNSYFFDVSQGIIRSLSAEGEVSLNVVSNINSGRRPGLTSTFNPANMTQPSNLQNYETDQANKKDRDSEPENQRGFFVPSDTIMNELLGIEWIDPTVLAVLGIFVTMLGTFVQMARGK